MARQEAIMKLAALQLRCSPSVDDNIARADQLIRHAAKQGAEFISLPEMFTAMVRAADVANYAQTLDGPLMQWAASLAKELGIALQPGTFPERDGEQLFNTAALFDAQGQLLGAYRKIHLFDVELDDVRSCESDTYTPGEKTFVSANVIPQQPDVTVGLTICYDVRFPEVFRLETLQGATVICLPSAFTASTGKDHWELLVRARAVENQVVMIAPNQWGQSPDGVTRHGHSMIVDAWGRILSAAPATEDTVIVANVELEEIQNVRRRLPSLNNRRPTSYN